MGCFIGCFGTEKGHKRRKHRINRANPQSQRNRDQNVNQDSIATAEHVITETPATDLDSELRNKPEGEVELSPSPRKRVTFNSNVTMYEHVSVHESVDSLLDCNTKVEKEKEEGLKRLSTESHSVSEDDNSVITSVGSSYPPNHRYHNARDSDDEYGSYDDSDIDDLDELDDEDEYDEYDEDVVIAQTTNETNTRSDYISSVLNPVENITQWKAAKSKGTTNPLNPQKENLNTNLEATFKNSPYSLKLKSDQLKSTNQEMAVDSSLSNWLVSPEIPMNNKTSFQDRPILGALTVEELRQNSIYSSPRKSSSRSPDEMPSIGTVGTYWNHST
ncbi:hypothetical protein ACJIZ3_011880 [Penstemon smallii]|uniref:Eisosome protein SEG2 n=1 Tax=Penstemon smallii TaxID=265156 RepID=A0ABD3UN96_9LAMI